MKPGDRAVWDIYLRHGFISRYWGVIEAFVDLDDMGRFAFLKADRLCCFHRDHPKKARELPPPTEIQVECVSKLVLL